MHFMLNEAFEFTTQEKNQIKKTMEELYQITLQLANCGVQMEGKTGFGCLGVIYHILETGKRGRGAQFKNVALSFKTNKNGISTNAQTHLITESSMAFVEEILNERLQFLQKHMPQVLENLRKNGINTNQKGVNIEDL